MQIYILLYKEVSLALKINSMYSKKRLLNIHENVRVLRYPDHISTGVYYWYAVCGLNSFRILIDIYGFILDIYLAITINLVSC